MIEKGVILAGGTGSRLSPCTKVTNKHLLPVYNKPMIFYPIETLKNAGIKEILIITGTESAGDFMKLLGSGEDIGVHFTFRIQDGSKGIADALRLAEPFANNENIAVILGDNIFEDDFSEAFKNFSGGSHVFVKEVPDPERFGVATLSTQNNVPSVQKIVEKPKSPESNFAVTGMYGYDKSVFEKIKSLTPSPRGEYEISEVNQQFIEENQMKASILQGDWSDAGTHESLFFASKLARKIFLNT
jgi:glucose-1-phosphate thymidylyltransferase